MRDIERRESSGSLNDPDTGTYLIAGLTPYELSVGAQGLLNEHRNVISRELLVVVKMGDPFPPSKLDRPVDGIDTRYPVQVHALFWIGPPARQILEADSAIAERVNTLLGVICARITHDD
jgi:hypothetical protein